MYAILEAVGALRGVALVIHGLNLKPERMQPLADELRGWGIAVVLCSLRGHGENYAPLAGYPPEVARLATFRQVSYTGWRAEVMAGYAAANALAQAAAVPHFLVAFSLGALLGCELLATTPTVHFDRMVLLAPALALRPHSHLPTLLGRWPALTLRSFAPRAYRCNPATPIAAYSALRTALRSLHRHANAKLNIPTLVLIDPQDELVSLDGMRRWVQRLHLTQWRFSLVNKGGHRADLRFHHLLLDADCVGQKMWQLMIAEMNTHLLS